MDRSVKTYMDELATGSLANTGFNDSGHIRVQDEPRIITAMNNALLRLFTQVKLRENETTIICHTHITDYKLDSKYSLIHGDPSIPYRYIFDPFHIFKDDVIKVISIYDDDGRDRPLNNYRNPFSAFTPNPNTVQLPVVVQDEPINVRYQASHPKLIDKDSIVSLGSSNLDLVFMHLVSYYTYVSLGSPEGMNQAQIHMADYSTMVQDMYMHGHILDEGYDEARDFYNKGWR